MTYTRSLACLLTFAVGVAFSPVRAQEYITVSPSAGIYFYGGLDDPLDNFRVAIGKGSIGVTGSTTTIGMSGSPVGLKFKLDRIELSNSAANFLVLAPTTGSIPSFVSVGLNESVVRSLPPGLHGLNVFFGIADQQGPSRSGIPIYLTISAPPAPAVSAIINTASFQPQVSPGCLVSIFGTHLGQPSLSGSYNEFGLYPKSLGGTSVTFNGIPAPLLYVATGQINAIVPYGLSGQKQADVVVTRVVGTTNQSSPAFRIALEDASPAIFTATQNGRGQAAILNYPTYVYNNSDNPAFPGSVVTLFATGMGAWEPAVEDGAIALIGDPNDLSRQTFSAKPIRLSIGGRSAKILYAGASSYQPWALLQVNAIVPSDAPSGDQGLVLTVGETDNAAQGVTMAIK